MEIIFHSHANKTHFHKKGCAPSLILKGRIFGTRKWPILTRFKNNWDVHFYCTLNPTVNSVDLLLTSDTTFLDHIINESCMSLFVERSELSCAVKIENATINELQTFESILQMLCFNCSRIIVIITQDFHLYFSTEHYP